ncbi:MAG TPA: hypothetical protein VD866_20665 [Urbifossiella sp.]|nr:hypothetical protein [Urbifossiella sp.]
MTKPFDRQPTPGELARSFRGWMDEHAPGWREAMVRLAAEKNPNWTRIEFMLGGPNGERTTCVLFDRGDDRPPDGDNPSVELIRFDNPDYRPPETTEE